MTSPDAGQEARPAAWPGRLALSFVLVTLAALVIVPWVVQSRVDALRAEIVTSEPARTLVMRWQFDLVREMAALSEARLTGDSLELARYGAVVAQEEALQRELSHLVATLGPEVTRPLAEARIMSARWHERVAEEIERSNSAGLTRLPRDRALFAEALETIAAVDSAIIRHLAETRQRIAAAEHFGLMLMLLLGLLALLAAVAVVALSSRMRRFAEESERRRRQADAALAERARADEARNRLLRGITHDVKNPLGAARGYAELLVMGVKAPLHPEQVPLLEGVERSVDSALAIIADLLDLARADSGDVALHRVETDVNGLARAAVSDSTPAATTAGHTIQADVGSESLMVYTDPVRVRQVLDNLLSNAIKYTPTPGRIVVRARTREKRDGGPGAGPWVVLEVADTGPGVPPEHRELVFDEFSRLQEGSPTKGHGLGLAIARSLARRLGGDLTIADESPGATFVLWIPLRREAAVTTTQSVRD